MGIFKRLSSSQEGEAVIRGDGMYIQCSTPKLFVKNVSDVIEEKPVSDQVSQLQFLDRQGRIESLISNFHSKNGSRGIKFSLRSNDGKSDSARVMLLDVGRRSMVIASRPPVVSRDSEVATADYVREMISLSHKVTVMTIMNGAADDVELSGLIPANEYRIGITFLVYNTVGDNSNIMSFQVGERSRIDCNIDLPGLYYGEQEVKTDIKGRVIVKLSRAITGYNGRVKVEASLAE